MTGLRFECTACGRCCTNHGEYAYVYVNPDEVDALARLLELPPAEFRRRYTFVDEDGWRQLRTRDEACVFLDRETGRCGVYHARPTQCRTFPFWREFVRDGAWTPEVRAMCEGIGRGPEHSPEYAEARMREFEASDEE